ncbi:MAG: hypothetical protein HYS20_01645 [Rhodocyclales bacterium]|nr:hypothetical protein [Rhodocyclales bacterium]
MTMKKTDLVKNLAKKLERDQKTAAIPQRFGQGAASVVPKRETRPDKGAGKPVPVVCRLPAELAARLRETAVAHEGGVNAVVTEALLRWFEAGKGS